MLSKKLCSRLLDGSLTDHRTYLSGNYRGYLMTVDSGNGRYIFKISAHSDNDPGNTALRMYVMNLRSSYKQIQAVNVYVNSLTVEIKLPNLAKKIPDRVNEAIEPIVDYLTNGAYVSGCYHCGTTQPPIDCYDINGDHQYLCTACVSSVDASLRNRQESIRSRKSRLIPGLVGALLGSMLGCAVYFIIWQFGYIASVAGLITAVCTLKGYEMLGGELDRKGILASIVVMLFAVFFANKLAWSYDAYTAFKEYYDVTIFDCFRSLNAVIKELDLTSEYYGNLAMALFLAILGSFGNIVSMFKASSGSYKITKADD